MFTGLIQRTGKVAKANFFSDGGGYLEIEYSGENNDPILLGESIAVNGVCLTVTKITNKIIAFDLLVETLTTTALAKIHTGSIVNLERALQKEGKIGGHFVTGHIDGVGKITEILKKGMDIIFNISCDDSLMNFIVSKGCIACDGVSLTVVDVKEKCFSVHLIPHTIENTNFKERKVGDTVNIEVDILAKYVKNFIAKDNNDKKSDSLLHKLRDIGVNIMLE